MIEPKIPADETARLAALHSLKVLDTRAEYRFDRITRLAKRLFGTDISLLSLVDRERQWFKSRQGLQAAQTPREIAFCAHAINADKPMIVPDATKDLRFHDNPLVTGNPNIRFYAGYPVSAPSGHKLGTLCVIDSKPRSWSDEDDELLRELGQMMEEELATLALATTDELTGLANRRGFTRIAEHMLPLAQRQNIPMAAIYIDMDGLKAVNDSKGHEAGDRVLKAFARHLLKNFRAADVVARLGGDEFCVLASGAAFEDVQNSVARLAQATAAHQPSPLAFSAGIAMYEPDRHDSVDALLQEADSRMYAAKKRKRDRDRTATNIA